MLFSKTPASRGAYHALFRDHAMRKTYEAVAPWDPALPWPVHRATRIQPSAHFMQQVEVDGAVNAITDIAPVEVGRQLARYALTPVTGQRHQLRVHMAALGLPLVGDGIYHTSRPRARRTMRDPCNYWPSRLPLPTRSPGSRASLTVSAACEASAR